MHYAGPVSTAYQRRLARQLRERVKELDCLHRIGALVLRHRDALDEVFQGVVDVLPPALQHPTRAVAMLRHGARRYRTADAPGTRTRIAFEAPIVVAGTVVGEVGVGYTSPRGSARVIFLPEERVLLAAVADYLALAIDRHDAVTALRRATAEHEDGPGWSSLARRAPQLTASELAICQALVMGLSSKDIAESRHIAVGTVARHRENIRAKLGLQHAGTNLVAHLIELTAPDEPRGAKVRSQRPAGSTASRFGTVARKR